MTEPLLNREAWETMKSMTEPDFLIELIDVFISDTNQLFAQIRSGLATGEVDPVRRAAHSLKSNSASIGAARLASAARALEMIARGGTLEGAAPVLAEIGSEFEQLLPVLAELKNEC